MQTDSRRRPVLALLALGLLIALLLAGQALAEPLSPAIAWWVVAAGGGPASGGAVSADGTFGQPIAGDSSGGNIALGAGYWHGAKSSIP